MQTLLFLFLKKTGRITFSLILKEAEKREITKVARDVCYTSVTDPDIG